MPALCPNCQKVKLVRCKSLRLDDPNYGKEYVGCSSCSSRWFVDDPDCPSEVMDQKPSKSIWKKLATWGAPHNVPDASGILHAATYVFPPAHEYPPILLPIKTAPSRLVMELSAPPAPSGSSIQVPAPSSPSPSDLNLLPAPPPPEPELQPLPEFEQVVLPERDLEPAIEVEQPLPSDEEAPAEETADQPPKDEEHPAEQNVDQPPKDETSSGHDAKLSSPKAEPSDHLAEEPSHQVEPPPPEAEIPSQEALPAPPEAGDEPQLDAVKSTSEHSPKLGGLKTTPSSPASNLTRDERLQLETLSRIAHSPMPAPLTSPRHQACADPDPSNPRSIHDSDYEPSYPRSTRGDDYGPPSGKTQSELLSPEEQHLRETLLRVIQTPYPTSPKAYSQLLSPRPALKEPASSVPPPDENDVSNYAQRIAKRIDQAIQNSPFISKDNLQTPHSERWLDSPKFTQAKSPASKHSVLQPSGRTTNRSVSATPRSNNPLHRLPPQSSQHSIAPSISGNSRSNQQRAEVVYSSRHSIVHSDRGTPRSFDQPEDQLPLPGAFPTPKPAPLTTEALSRLGSQTSHHGGSARSRAPSHFLPVAPSHYRSTAGSRASKRVSIASVENSPLFN